MRMMLLTKLIVYVKTGEKSLLIFSHVGVAVSMIPLIPVLAPLPDMLNDHSYWQSDTMH